MITHRVLSLAVFAAVTVAVVIGYLAVGRSPVKSYPWHLDTTASEFSPLENPGPDNAFISNAQSAWDKDWRAHAPQENAYFVAVPYADYLSSGDFNPDNVRIPWHVANVPGQSELKNRWVQLESKASGKTRTAFGQVEDTGPSDTLDDRKMSDPDYVFGPLGHDASQPILVKPKNTFDLRAGIDLSPAAAKSLGLDGSGNVSWRFVDRKDVPPGLWTATITVSPPNW